MTNLGIVLLAYLDSAGMEMAAQEILRVSMEGHRDLLND
jgi:hypothetical protein